MSYKVAFVLLLPFLRTLPIDWRFRIRDLDGEAKMTLWRFLMLIPVEKVPYEAIMIALLSISVIDRTSSRSSVATPPCTKKTCRCSSTLLSCIKLYSGSPCPSTLANRINVLPLRSRARFLIKLFLFWCPIIYWISSSKVGGCESNYYDCYRNPRDSRYS